MNNKAILAIIGVLVIAAGVYYFTSKNSGNEVDSNSQSGQGMSTETNVENSSIKELLANGKTQMCKFSVVEEGAAANGTVYVSNGKMRGDFTGASEAGATQVSHMIHDGSYSYVWVDGMDGGFKMAINAADAPDSSPNNQVVDQNKNFEFNCERWTEDSSKFELPQGVTFSEMPTIPAGAGAGASGSFDTKAIQQAACNNLPEPAKSSCLSAIK